MRKKDVKRCQSSKGWSSSGRISCWGCSLRGWECEGQLRARCSLATSLTFRANRTSTPKDCLENTPVSSRRMCAPSSQHASKRGEGRSCHQHAAASQCRKSAPLSLSCPLFSAELVAPSSAALLTSPSSPVDISDTSAAKMQFKITKGQKNPSPKYVHTDHYCRANTSGLTQQIKRSIVTLTRAS